MRYVGIDLGTSSVKLILLNEAGDIENSVSKEYPLVIPEDGWSEQDPNEWYEKTIIGLKELIKGHENDIDGIGIAGQMHGLVVLDKDDKVLRNAILWNDGRSSEETKYLNEEIGKDTLASLTGNIAFAGFTAPKILWMKKHEKELFDKIAKIMLPKDYLVYRLTGAFTTDYSDASGMLLLDVKEKCWSEKMCEICGINVSMLPELHESYDIVGKLTKDLRKELNLPHDVSVVAGAGDNAGSAIGTGTIENGKCNISIGTSGTVFISTDKYSEITNNAIHNFCHATGKYHLMGCILSAASCNKWFMDNILKTKDYAKEQEPIDIKMLGENKIIFLPYLMGERTPINNVDARGVFFGLSLDTKREDMVLAVLEGVAFALRDSVELARSAGITIKKATLVGGGAISKVWQEVIANVSNIELEILESNEGPSLGGAILAAFARGKFDSLSNAAKKANNVIKTVEPNKEIVVKYNEKYKKYKSLYNSLEKEF